MRAQRGTWNQKGQLDDGAPWKPVAFRAAQPKCNIDGARLRPARLLGDLSERRGAVVNLDLHLAVCFRFELLDPRLDDVELEKARRSQKMAKLERDRLRMGRAKCKREQYCKRQNSGTHCFIPA